MPKQQKILLINSPIRFNAWQNREIPLGVAYLAAVLEADGNCVSIKDFEVEPFSITDFAAFFQEFNPSIVGISFRSSSVGPARELSTLARRLNPDIRILLGGHHATAFPEETLSNFNADAVVRGEGEEIILRVLHAWETSNDLSEVQGVTFRLGERVISTLPAAPIADLDMLPFPAWHLLPMEKYTLGSILTSRGCPFACVYCDKGISTRTVRFRSPENIFQEILSFEKAYKRGRLYFVDDHLFLNRQRFFHLCNLLREERDISISWTCQSRVDGVDRKILEKAHAAGCERIIFGVETGDQTELGYIQKKASLEEAETAISLAKSIGISTRANFMIGFPISTHAMAKRTIRFAKRLNADISSFFLVAPLPQTPLWDDVLLENPDMAHPDWSRFDLFTPAFPTIEISKDQLVHYLVAGYVLASKTQIHKELSRTLLFRLSRFVQRVLQSGRLRGNFALIFPGLANLLIHLIKIFARLPKRMWLFTLKKSLRLAREIDCSDSS